MLVAPDILVDRIRLKIATAKPRRPMWSRGLKRRRDRPGAPSARLQTEVSAMGWFADLDCCNAIAGGPGLQQPGTH